jgi:sorbitol-specific phosphotransferase system component IIBC
MALFDRFRKKGEEADEAVAEVKESVSEASVPAAEAPSAAAAPAPVEAPPPGEYRKVRIKKGKRGWGVGLEVKPQPGKDLIYSVTGGGIHPVAQRIADLSGGRPFDGFRSKADFHEIAVAVIDCGGTARIGVYPMKGVPTVDVHGASPSGPLMRFITEENFVSGVSVDDIEVIEG